ncbi:hypothetical protein [Clostridium magnum]|uniref:HTH DNA binding domain protein n=1 Tax=Clostridium magnum DSM 2767 TaxID=1121326 RepID=A0A161XG28_9CLOT|nr:hypothetical protein [Clostridium magnum]KZL93526.1 HTH DNA binding domain protein [Clostridium magnum DSM 2767]SHJ68834.1 hypothetical protein SAMN02745944_06334 [Clostridium magnum DSM 2767]
MVNVYDFYITPEEYEMAEANGISKALLEVRIRRLAWNKEKAISISPSRHKRLGSDWIKLAQENGICYSTFKYRANELGWDLERAATQPLQDRKAQAKQAYEKSRKYPKEFKELAEKNGISERTFHRRLESGWDIETAATKPIMTPREVGLLTKEKRQKSLTRIFCHKRGVNKLCLV